MRRLLLLLSVALLCLAFDVSSRLQVFTEEGWKYPEWTGNAELDQAFVLNNQRRFQEAFDAFSALDGKDVATGTAMLGRYYEQGRAVKRDEMRALGCYAKAKEMWDPLGIYHYYRVLGKVYEPAPSALLVPLLEECATGGSVICKVALADWLLRHPKAKSEKWKGSGASMFESGYELDKEAGRAGYAPAQFRAGWLEENSFGDPKSAQKWFDMARENKFQPDFF